MTPQDFEQANFTFGKPDSMTDEQCGSLRVFRGKDTETDIDVIVSQWQPSVEELERIKRGEPIFLTVYGRGMPAVSLSGHNPFDCGWVKE